MGLDYVIDAARGVVTITGDCAGATEWDVLLARAMMDPAWRSGLVALLDQRHGRQSLDVAAVVETMAVVFRMWPSLGLRRAAIVARSDVLAPALVAHALADAEHVPIHTFTSYDVALEWLAVSDISIGM